MNITFVSLKGGCGKTTTAWLLATYFANHYKKIGFNGFTLTDLDYLQSNMEQYNEKLPKSKQMTVETISTREEFLALADNTLYDEDMINIIDTGRYDSETNFLSYVVSDIIIVTLNPREEIEFRNAIATLIKMDELFSKEDVDAPLVKILYTRVHPNSKFSSFSPQNAYLREFKFETIKPELYQCVVYNNKLTTIGSQHGESFWTYPHEDDSKLYAGMQELVQSIKQDFKKIKGLS